MGRLNKAKWCLIGSLTVILVLVAGSVFTPDRLSDAVQWVANNDFTGKLTAPTKQEAIHQDGLIEMVVDRIGLSKIDYQPVVVLKEKGGELYLPIWIGVTEANAISVILEGVEVPRPLTPDLLRSIIDSTGASVKYIVINDLRDNTFYANIILHTNRRQTEIDARPSDAIAIALRVRAPIYVAEAVLKKAGAPFEHERDKYTIMRLE